MRASAGEVLPAQASARQEGGEGGPRPCSLGVSRRWLSEEKAIVGCEAEQQPQVLWALLLSL